MRGPFSIKAKKLIQKSTSIHIPPLCRDNYLLPNEHNACKFLAYNYLNARNFIVLLN